MIRVTISTTVSFLSRLWTGVNSEMENGIICASLSVMMLCLFASVSAADLSISVLQNGVLNDNLVMQFQAKEVFTEKVIKFLNRGFTVRIDYTIELWQSRRFWFDHLDRQRIISYQIDFELFEKRYTCSKLQKGKVIESKLDRKLDEIVLWTTRPESPLTIIPADQLDQDASYYYNMEILIATPTTENLKRLQERLSESGEEEKNLSTLTKATFRIARDYISSKNSKKLAVRSEEFHLRDLPKFASD
jgi:hypothetical protein